MLMPFHLAIHVDDLDAARVFYGEVLGCREGRSAATWVDFDFFGHQLSLHVGVPAATAQTGQVDAHKVAMPHFGAVLDVARFNALAERIAAAGVDFDLPPTLRFAGEPGAQWTMFFRDPAGNAIEIKGYVEPSGVFAVSEATQSATPGPDRAGSATMAGRS